MSEGDDLFTFAERYPHIAGHKGDLETGRQAAASMASELSRLRLACMRELAGAELTADEIAGRLELSVLAVRPRVSELRAMGFVEPTEERRKNASGRSAVVWRIKT